MFKRISHIARPLSAEKLLDEAKRLAEAYGWSMLPTIGKKPALKTWKQFQRERPCEKELLDGFSDPRVTGLAVICGPVSNDLAVRDFDVVEAYERWRRRSPGLAKVLPTSRTWRGYQIFYRSPTIKRIKQLADGENRGSGYVVIPPSLHPKGVLYEWVNKPGFEIPLISDEEALWLDGGTPSESNFVQKPCITTVEAAITATLPYGTGRRNRQLMYFSQYLLKILGKEVPEADLKAAVKAWHRRALPFIRTKDFRTTWNEFRCIWCETRFVPACLDDAIATAKNLVADHRPLKLLRATCRRLQEQFGDRPFFLGVRTVAEKLDVDRMTANRLLLELEKRGELVRIRTGSLAGRRATEWRYRWPEAGEDETNQIAKGA